MKVAIIGSRGIKEFNLKPYIPWEITEIISGGATGVDTWAKQYSKSHNLKLTEFFPDYDTHGKNAPLIRNIQIVNYADAVIAFWDGKSKGTKFVIDYCRRINKELILYMPKGYNFQAL